VVFGRDPFTCAGSGALVTLTVTGIEDAPIAYDIAFTIAPDGRLSGSVLIDNGAGADHDPEGAALTLI
jgi:hypothetical protein